MKRTFIESFYTFFPPPKFLQTPAVGLSISPTEVRFLEIVQKDGQNKLGRFGRVELSDGCIIDDVLRDKEALGKVLSDISREHGITHVHAAVPERKAFIVKMEIPKVKESEIRDAIELRLEEFVPIRARDLVFDYSIVRLKGVDCGTLELQVSALPKQVLAEYEELFSGVGITPLSLEIEAQAAARAAVPYGDPGAFLVVDLDRSRSGVYIVENGVVRFTSSLETSSCSWRDALIKDGPMTTEEVEQYLALFDAGAGEDDISTHPEASAIFEVLGKLREEIDKHYIYWRTHNKSSTGSIIEKVVLTGSEAGLRGIAEYLSEHLAVPVEVADVWQNAFNVNGYVPEISREHSHGYAVACGLALYRSRSLALHKQRT